MGMDMLQARLVKTKVKESEVKSYVNDISITPLSIPMLCGPGAITNAIVMWNKATDWAVSYTNLQMMNEIAAIKEAIHPNETLFVVDAMTGQDAVNTAREFNERLDFNGVILTKLDGDTRGGAALSIRTVVNKPIKYVGTGEKLEALDAFHPERMADRILGMGDIVSLVEKAQEQFDAEEAKKLQKKISRNQFNFNDFLSQIQQIKKMGNIKMCIRDRSKGGQR